MQSKDNKLKIIRILTQYLFDLSIDKMLPNTQALVLGKDYPLTRADLDMLETIKKLYIQQKQMYDTKTRTCENRIVRGKQNAR